MTQEEEPLADAIRKVAAGFDKLTKSGLNRKAVVVLLSYETGVGIKTIEKVLDGLGRLAKIYTKG